MYINVCASIYILYIVTIPAYHKQMNAPPPHTDEYVWRRENAVIFLDDEDDKLPTTPMSPPRSVKPVAAKSHVDLNVLRRIHEYDQEGYAPDTDVPDIRVTDGIMYRYYPDGQRCPVPPEEIERWSDAE